MRSCEATTRVVVQLQDNCSSHSVHVRVDSPTKCYSKSFGIQLCRSPTCVHYKAHATRFQRLRCSIMLQEEANDRFRMCIMMQESSVMLRTSGAGNGSRVHALSWVKSVVFVAH